MTNDSKKIFLTLIPIILLGPIAMDIFLPVLPMIKNYFQISVIETQWTLSIFVAGFGVCQILVGFLSDKYGVQNTLLTSVIIFITASIICASSSNLPFFLIGRLMQALSSCCCMVLSFALARNISLRDIESVQAFSILSSCTGLAPIIAPLIGGLIVQYYGSWKYTFYFQALLATIGAGLFVRNMGSISHILKLSNQSCSRNFKSYGLVLKDFSFWHYAFFGSAGMIMLFTFFSVVPYIMLEEFHLSEKRFPTIFSIYSAGFICGNIITTILIKKINLDIILTLSYLAISFLSSIMIIFTNYISSLQIFTIFMFSINFFIGMSFGGSMSGAMKNFERNSATAASVYGAQQFMMAFCVTTLLVTYNFNTQYSLSIIILITSISVQCASFFIKKSY
ncbi:MAG: Bcr/CflA family efflux MFS transporter [Wolbachia pipientis]|nr:Bcr/CflA family efflux MFS transporter [Wolbachia pipientis]